MKNRGKIEGVSEWIHSILLTHPPNILIYIRQCAIVTTIAEHLVGISLSIINLNVDDIAVLILHCCIDRVELVADVILVCQNRLYKAYTE